MKILAVIPYAGWSPTYEYELEIAQDHLDAGDEVCVAVCNAALSACDQNPMHDSLDCSRCVGRRLFGLAHLSQAIRQIPLVGLTIQDRDQTRQLPRHFASLAEVQALYVDNFDLGWAALSSVIAVVKEPEPLLSDPKVSNLLHNFMVSALAVYRSLIHVLDEEKFDRVYILNGRLAVLRAAVRACQWVGTEFYTHERGWNLNHYSLHKNTMIHNPTYMKNLILESWEAADPQQREQVGRDYFEQRAAGEGFNWPSFVAGQDSELLPDDWSADRDNIVLYTTSDHETATLGKEWRSPAYPDQMTAIEHIVGTFGQDNRHLYIRIHPNSRGLHNSTTARLAAIRQPGVSVIPADSRVSSYALLKACSKSVAFTSRMGIEAAYWRKPSILLGITVYRELGSTYNPESPEEVLELLQQNLEPKEPTGALQYGHFFRTFGQRAHYFEPTGVGQGKYRSIELRQTGLYASIGAYLEEHPWVRRAVGGISRRLNSLRLGGKL